MHDVATQCAPAESTRFYFQSSERSREGAGASSFVRSHFDVVSDRETDDKWVTMEEFERVAYDELVCPPGHRPPGFRATAASSLEVPEPVGGVQWTSLNNEPPGTCAFHFDIKQDPPRLSIHPELREWQGPILSVL